MDSHLVTIEVSVERGTGERMQLDGLSFDHLGLESLDTEPVKGRCTVEEHRMSLHDILKDVPNDGILAVDDLLSGLDCLDDTPFDELADDERFVEFRCHELRKTAFMHVQFRSYDDDRTC